MTNRFKGQLRIGSSGSISVGEQLEFSQKEPPDIPHVVHRQRLEKIKRRPSKISHHDRKERNKKKMRASLSESAIVGQTGQTNTQIIEESQITRLGSVSISQPEIRTTELSIDELSIDELSIDELSIDELSIDEPFVTHRSHKKNHKNRRIEKFDRLVKDNKDSGRDWFYGLEGNWWWGMSEEEARQYIVESETQRDLKKELKKKQKWSNKKMSKPQIRTVGEIIDEMTSKYNKELPKDPMKRISYIYPLKSTHSFNIVAANHIKYLRHKYIVDNDNIEIEEVDWSQLSNLDWEEKRNILIHPFLYPFASYESFIQNSKNFAKLLATKHKIGGFDVADSTKISKIAVDLINKIDLIMVPSNSAKDAFVNSGVTIPVEVLPHGVPDEFLGDYPIYSDNIDITKLRKMKEKGNILILYFLVHSSHRKGADLVKEVMKRIQNKFNNVYLVVKSEDVGYFSKIRSIYLESWMSSDNLRLLYDTCDICLSPSRGGGFELNALEAISRGVPTLVTNGGCFLDLIDYYIPIDLSDKAAQSLPGNPIHTGLGYECNIDDFEKKLEDVIRNLDKYKEIFKGRSEDIRKIHTWREVARILDRHLKNHGFIE